MGGSGHLPPGLRAAALGAARGAGGTAPVWTRAWEGGRLVSLLVLQMQGMRTGMILKPCFRANSQNRLVPNTWKVGEE